jgi:hypothetical protein
MTHQRLLLALSVANILLLGFSLTSTHLAGAQDPLPILRGRALQIVDDQGRVRASISVLPEGPARPVPDGKIYPETVLLRLIDPNGRPGVKLGASVEGAGLGLAGAADPTYVVLSAQNAEASLKLTAKNDRQLVLKP